MNNGSQKSEENIRPQRVLRLELSGDAAIHNGIAALTPVVVQLEFSKTVLGPRRSKRFHAKAQSTQRTQRK
jgi:hypothetical protein